SSRADCRDARDYRDGVEEHTVSGQEEFTGHAGTASKCRGGRTMSEMNASCKDRDRIFEDGSAAEWAALEVHAEGCAECAEEIRAWKAISVAAREMREESAGPELWARIEQGLAQQARKREERRDLWAWLGAWRLTPVVWQAAAASAIVLLLLVSGVWLIRSRNDSRGGDAHLLKNPALADVERTEAAYVQAIDKLAAEAKPELENPATPLLSSYKEKLLVLDGAIEDLRAQAGVNPSNAHVRR